MEVFKDVGCTARVRIGHCCQVKLHSHELFYLRAREVRVRAMAVLNIEGMHAVHMDDDKVLRSWHRSHAALPEGMPKLHHQTHITQGYAIEKNAGPSLREKL